MLVNDRWARANIFLERGDDVFAWNKIEVPTSLILDGGSGGDELRVGDDLHLPPKPVVRNWENVVPV